MTTLPTSHHAVTLFTLTMETRFGPHWERDLAPDAIAVQADEVALGFGGRVIGPESTQTGGQVPTLWRFPDGSLIRTGFFGLREDEAPAQTTHRPAASRDEGYRVAAQ